MKRSLKTMAVTALAVSALAVSAFASDYDHCADKLKALGLFQGTSQGYELDKAPTRAEAGVMLVRLLGKESEAKTLTYDAPFTDVEDWQKPYVQYLYTNELTSGVNETTFAPGSGCDDKMYSTFLLRALGYSDKGGDFTYSNAVDFAKKVGVADYLTVSDMFLRDDVVAMSYTALNTYSKGSEVTLLEKLVTEGAVTKESAQPVLDMFAIYDSYAESVEKAAAVSKIDADIDVSLDASMAGKTLMKASVPMNFKMLADEKAVENSAMQVVGKINLEMDKSLVEEGAETKVSQDFSLYLKDKFFYMNMADEKYKVDASAAFENVTSVEAINVQASDPVSMIQSITKSDEVYTIVYAGSSFNSVFDMVMASMESTGMGAKVSDVKVTRVVENGQVKSADFSMKMAVSVEGTTMNMDAAVKLTVKETGDNVVITFPADLATYKVVDAVDSLMIPAA